MELTHSDIEQPYPESSVPAYRSEAVLVELIDGCRVVLQSCRALETKRRDSE
jgi:hypothetical protein